jgi:hypothetical protein
MSVVDRRREAVARSVLDQAAWCNALGSPMYGAILERVAKDVRAGGPAWRVMGQRDVKDVADALRLLGAVHRLVLTGRAPDLARFYPSAGGSPAAGDPWPAFRSVLEEQGDAVREGLVRRVQTNEVGRSAALLGGFLLIARETGLPLALAEMGASAGLNLRWDRYRYESGGEAWGEADSPVRFSEPFVSGRPPLDVEVEVIDRRGCDLDPVDPVTVDGRLTLVSYMWPDQTERLERLRGALEVARQVPAQLERAEGTEWLEEALREPRQGVATVVFHSVVEMYLSPETQERLRAILASAGERAMPEAPLAWLRMEHLAGSKPEPGGPTGIGPRNVHLTVWPGGEERALAAAAPHGPPVFWYGR